MYVNVMSIIHDSANFYFHGLSKFMNTDMYFYGIICTNVLSIFVFRYWFLGHLSDAGDLLLWVGVRRHSSCVVRQHLLFKYYWANLNQTWYVASVG